MNISTTALPTDWSFGDDLLAPAGSIRLTATNRETGEVYCRWHRTTAAARKSIAGVGPDWSVKAYRIVTGGHDGDSATILL